MSFLSGERRGSQAPRFELVPKSALYYDAGQEAVELAASAGLELLPWQRRVLKGALSERRDGRWAAKNVGLVVPRQNGKGTVLEAAELYWLLVAGEKKILHSSHLFKTSKDAFNRLLDLLNYSQDLLKKVSNVRWSKGEEGIDFANGAKIDFVSRSKGGGRGLQGDKLVLDEAFALKDEHIEAIQPTMATRRNGQIWLTSTPPLDTISGGPMFALRERALKGDDRVFWADWGAPPHVDVADEDEWYKSNPSMGYLIELETMRDFRASMTEEGFSREHLGVWPQSIDNAIIPTPVWESLADTDSQIVGDMTLAVDITPSRDYAAIAVYGRRADGNGHVEIVDHRRGSKWVVERLLQLVDRHKPLAIAVDSKGPAGTLIVDLQAEGFEVTDATKPTIGCVLVPKYNDVASATASFVDACIDSESIRHIDQPELTLALVNAQTRPLGDAFAWGRRTSEADISPLVAATLARWAYEAREHVIEGERYEIMDSIGF